MNCPACNSTRFTPNDKIRKRLKCLGCGKKINLNPQKRGRKAINEKAMTSAERKRRQREKEK